MIHPHAARIPILDLFWKQQQNFKIGMRAAQAGELLMKSYFDVKITVLYNL